MKKVIIRTEPSYEVLIEEGLLENAGELIKKACPRARNLALVSDSLVEPLYGDLVANSLKAAGFKVFTQVFTAGEASKNLDTYGKILNFLAESRLDRADAVVALGGGVAGDMAGFAAATYMRGIRYVNIPTTLLACVDSSVGGKTGINLAAGKNLAGAFHQPSLVICDPLALRSISRDVYEEGCAEVIKYCLLGSASLFESIGETPVKLQYGEVIYRCVEMKRAFVEEDETDRGERQKLNLGHTFGHAIEKCSAYRIAHGRAVAAGMAIMARAAFAKGYCDGDLPRELEKLLKAYNLPVNAEFPADKLREAVMWDKKMSSGKLNLVVPRKIGRCTVEPADAQDVAGWLFAGLEKEVEN